MGFFSKKPKIKVQTTKSDGYSGWLKCSNCEELMHESEVEKAHHCCPKCHYHYRLTARERIALLTDEGSFTELFSNVQSTDPLDFTDAVPYTTRLEKARAKSSSDEAVIVGTANMHSMSVAIAVLDFNFMGGSMGSVVGERLTRLIEHAQENALPLLIVSSSGGARMQESTLSLMQMAKTSGALARYHDAGFPYISVLTNPTLGGVTASFATLGDVILAEPNALIGFAGPRVVEQTIRQKLPPEAQKSKFVLDNGFIDSIVPRAELKKVIVDFFQHLSVNIQRKQQAREKKSSTRVLKTLRTTAREKTKAPLAKD